MSTSASQPPPSTPSRAHQSGVRPSRVFVARLAGLAVFDPQGDQVGRVRDVVVTVRPDPDQPRVLGLVVEVFGRRRIFVPMSRVTNIDAGQVITTGVVNMRRFSQRPTETLVIGQMLDRRVTIPASAEREQAVEGTVFDIGIEPTRTQDWVLSRVAVQQRGKRFGRRGQTHVAEWSEVEGLTRPQPAQGATHLLATLEERRPTDLAATLHDLPPKRRTEIAAALDDAQLADVLEELPEADQVEVLGSLAHERAALVLEEMSPDDATDLVADLPAETAEHLLRLMQPGDADEVRRLLTYEERTAGGMMTTEPVVLPPDSTVADALAHVRNPDLTPALASMVFCCRPPLDTPTGRLLGVGHIQRLLREPPSTLVSAMVEDDIDSLQPDARVEEVATHLAAYNLVAAPVVDDNGHLLGAVTVDDLLDHLLPSDWRERTRSQGAGDG